MSIQLEGKIPYTNDGWVLLFNQNRESATKNFVEQHGKVLLKPNTNPKIALRLAYLISQMPSEYRVQYLHCLNEGSIGSYIESVQQWTPLTLEEKIKYCDIGVSLNDPIKANNFINYLDELLTLGHQPDVTLDYSSYHIMFMLHHPSSAMRNFGVQVVRYNNELSVYKDVIEKSNELYGDSYSMEEQLVDLIQKMKEGDVGQVNKKLLNMMTEHKDHILDSLSINDPVFLYNPSHEMLFKWVTHHYSVKHGGADIVKKNVRNKHALEIDFFYDNPILFPYLTEQFLEKICSSSERKHLEIGRLKLSHWMTNVRWTSLQKNVMYFTKALADLLNRKMFVMNPDMVQSNFSGKPFREELLDNKHLLTVFVIMQVYHDVILPPEYKAEALIWDYYMANTNDVSSLLNINCVESFIEEMKKIGFKKLIKPKSGWIAGGTLESYFENKDAIQVELPEECEILL